ncbi:MAG: hypothetical protein ACKVOW_08670, partial [Chitinophagaceae bacterium]
MSPSFTGKEFKEKGGSSKEIKRERSIKESPGTCNYSTHLISFLLCLLALLAKSLKRKDEVAKRSKEKGGSG